MLVAIPVQIDDSRRFDAKPVANGAVVVANVLLFVLFQTAGWSLAPGGRWWSIVSYAFAHASPWHLIGNMYVLLLVGNAVNRRVGNFYYLVSFFGTVIAMGIFGRLLGVGPLVGSSGAIFAMVAVMLMLIPAARIDVSYVALFPTTFLVGLFHRPGEFVEWFLRFGQIRVRAWWCIVIVPILELWGFLWWRFAQGNWQWTHPAHLLGLLCGVAIVLMLPSNISMNTRSRTV